MKKTIRLVSAALIIILLLSSCESSQQNSVSVPLPVFGDTSSERGIKEMPIEYFENNHLLACTVMTIMPTMTNLEAVEINISGTSLKNVKTSFTVFGFDIELVTDSSHINRDGVYLQYRILYNGSNVGFCDYYYNIEKKTFSYRQSVFCTFDILGSSENQILNMEYIDIPIENPLEPVFKVGQLTTGGVLDDNALIDNIWFNTQTPKKARFLYRRAFITLNEVRGDDGLYTMYAFKQPDNATEAGPVDFSGEFEVFRTVLAKYLDDDETFIIDTDAERNKADFELMKEIYPLVYKNGQSIADHHSTVKGYTSYEDFVADSFREQTARVTGELHNNSINNVPSPVIYTYNGKESTGASTVKTPAGGANIIYGPSFTSLNGTLGDEYSGEKGYTLLGFRNYFGEYDSEGNTVTVSDFTTRKFLKACGINNEDYIRAFIEFQNKYRDYATPAERITVSTGK